MLLTLLPPANCGHPELPTNGSIGTFTRTTRGASVTFRCNDGFIPTTEEISFCTSSGIWYPTPADHICILQGNATSF